MYDSAILQNPNAGSAISGMDITMQKINRELKPNAETNLNTEIEKIGRMLIAASEGKFYRGLEENVKDEEMGRIGREILSYGGTFPALTVLAVTEHEGRFMVKAVDGSDGRDFTIPCSSQLKQYIGSPIDSLDELQAYVGEKATIDVLRNGRGYEAVLIGKANQVLNDAPQATSLDLIH